MMIRVLMLIRLDVSFEHIIKINKKLNVFYLFLHLLFTYTILYYILYILYYILYILY